jgi:hypothetical protein
MTIGNTTVPSFDNIVLFFVLLLSDISTELTNFQ